MNKHRWLDARELAPILEQLRAFPGTLLLVWYPEKLKHATSNYCRLQRCPSCTDEAERSGLGGVVYHNRGITCYKEAKSMHQQGRTRKSPRI